jgi:adenosylhomocysteinase
MRNTNLWVAGKNVVVVGFGWVGRGIAEDAMGLGAQVVVTEVDPVAALEAHTNGYRVMSMAEAAPIGDIFVTCTGSVNVIDAPHFSLMKDGAILANAGHHALEINARALETIATKRIAARPNVDEFAMPDGRGLFLIASGEVVNLTAAEGHPIEIMDLTFAVQASAIHYLARHGTELGAGVQQFPAAIDDEIAQTKLETLGVTLDAMTPEQTSFMAAWE